MLVVVERHGPGIVEDGPERAGVLQFLAHLVIGVAGGVGIQQAGAVELVEEPQAFHIDAVVVQAGKEFAVLRVVVSEAQLVIAVEGRAQRLHIHDHVAVPVRPGAQRVGLVADLVRRADFLHGDEQVDQVVQGRHFRISQFLVQVPAHVPGIEEGLVAVRAEGDVEAEAVDLSVPADLPVAFQGVRIVFHDIRGVGFAQVKLLPVEQHALGDRVLVVVAVGAPDDDIAQVAGFHPRGVGTVLLRDDVDLNTELVPQQCGAPALLDAGKVGQLAVNVQPDDALFRFRFFRQARRSCQQHCQAHHHRNQFPHCFFLPVFIMNSELAWRVKGVSLLQLPA